MKATLRIKQLAIAVLAFAATITQLPAQVLPLPQVKEREDLKKSINHTRGGFDTLGRRWGDAPPAAEPAPAPVAQPAPVVSRWGNLVDIERTSPGQVAVGQEFNSDIIVRANGDAADIVVTDVIPDGAELVSATPTPTRNGNTLVWKFNAMDAGEVNNIKVRYKAVKEGSLRSCAKVHALPRICTVVTVGRPRLAITKTGPETAVINDDVTYTITVSNPGNMVTKNVVVTDTVPAGMSAPNGEKTLTWNIGDLNPGEKREVPVTLKAAAKGKHCNKAMAKSSNGGKVEAEACTRVLQPGLNVDKTGPAERFLYKMASYTIKVTNSGETTLHDVIVTDNAPAATSIRGTKPTATVDGNTAQWTVPSLAPGASKSFEIVLTTSVPGTHPNSVSVSTREGLTGEDKAPTLWRGISALLITVEDAPDPIQIGETTTYTIRVRNQGSRHDTNVKLEAVFDDEVVPVSASNGGTVAGNKVTFPPYPKLESKQSFTYTIQAKGAKPGDHRLKVTRTSDDIPKPTTAEESTRVF